MKNILWIVLDLIPLIIAAQVQPPAAGFGVGLLIALGLFVFQKLRFGEVNTIIKVKTVLFLACIAVSLRYPEVNLLQYMQLFIYGILASATIFSLLVRKPFTLQYAKKSVAPEYWTHPLFVSINYWLSAGWAFTFAISLLFSLLYVLNVTTGVTGVLLSNIWNIIGFAVTFLAPPLVRRYHRASLKG